VRDARRSTTAHAGGLVCIPPFAASRPLSAATPRSKPNRVSWRSDSRRRIVRPSSHRPRSCRAARLACACNSQRRIQTQRSKASSTCSPNLAPRPTVPVTTSSHCPGPCGQTWYALPAAAAPLDALAALKERSLVERDAPPLLRPGIYLVREDEALIEQAVDRFEAIRLTWHAEQSRKLLART